MNYLSHFVFNHGVCGLPQEPYFVFAVALPDLWLRYTRARRIRWKAVRAATPMDEIDRQVRDGLLNHTAADRQFHSLPVFLRWQTQLKEAVPAGGVHPVVVDFVAHAAIELALDHHLLRDNPGLADHYYDTAAACDPAVLAVRVQALGDVDTTGLDRVLRRFVARRFLRRYRRWEALPGVIRLVLRFARVPLPPRALVEALSRAAVELVRPETVWRAMRGAGPARGA